MKSFKPFMLAAFFLAVALASTAFIRVKLLKKANSDNSGFAVVELFTSEGCSSCPPADELVARLEKESAGKPVYILAYHVDYWNHLGWKDPYSNADFSKRQHNYANYLHLQSVYTPQIVVNGTTEFVGSQEGTLRNAIRSSLQKVSAAQVSLSVLKSDKTQVNVKYAIEGTAKNSVLFIALLQKHAQTKVMRGENEGRTLSHVQIVITLQRVVLNGNTGIANIALPKGIDNQEIIGFLQTASTGAILGAGRVVLTPEVSANAVRSSK